MSEKVGRQLVDAGVPLAVWYGGTEFGPPVKILDIDNNPETAAIKKTKDDWQYIEIESDMIKHRWVPEGDGTYELQIIVSISFYVFCPALTVSVTRLVIPGPRPSRT